MRFDKLVKDWRKSSNPVTGPAFPAWSAITQIAIHYPGADWAEMDFNNDGREDYRDTAVLLDNTNGYYWSSRGYAIGYNGAADVFGLTWELRGDTVKCAANKGHNDWTFAILVIVDGDNPATPAQIDAVRDLVGQVRVLCGRQVPIMKHKEIGSTACPGTGVSLQVDADVFEPPLAIPAPVLRFGDRGERVRVLRDHLVFWKCQKRSGPQFGVFTRRAVRRFQRLVGAPVTGVYDLATYDAYLAMVTK